MVVASKVRELEAIVDKTKNMVMSRDQNAGRNHNLKTDNSTFERMRLKMFGKNFKESEFYLGKKEEQIEVREYFCHSVQNLLCSSLLSKIMKIKVYGTIILSVILYG